MKCRRDESNTAAPQEMPTLYNTISRISLNMYSSIVSVGTFRNSIQSSLSSLLNLSSHTDIEEFEATNETNQYNDEISERNMDTDTAIPRQMLPSSQVRNRRQGVSPTYPSMEDNTDQETSYTEEGEESSAKLGTVQSTEYEYPNALVESTAAVREEQDDEVSDGDPDLWNKRKGDGRAEEKNYNDPVDRVNSMNTSTSHEGNDNCNEKAVSGHDKNEGYEHAWVKMKIYNGEPMPVAFNEFRSNEDESKYESLQTECPTSSQTQYTELMPPQMADILEENKNETDELIPMNDLMEKATTDNESSCGDDKSDYVRADT